MKKIIKMASKISIFKTIYYNVFSNKVKRDKKCYLIIFKGAILELKKGSKIIVKNKNLCLGTNKLKGSKAETLIRLEKNAKWISNNGGGLSYSTTIELKENAVLTTGFFTINTGTVIICKKKIDIGDDVMVGRNNLIYDSDFHKIYTKEKNICEEQKNVTIGNHVWITSNVTILKGVNIGDNAIISPQSVIRNDVESNSFCGDLKQHQIFSNEREWQR